MDTVGTDGTRESAARRPGRVRVPGRPRLNGQRRILLLISVLVCLDVVLFPVVCGSPLSVSMPADGWLLAPAFVVADLLVFHLQFRRNAYSFTLSEVPLVVGLVLLPPGQLVLAQLAGVLIVLTVFRRQSLHKLLFNVAQFTLTTLMASELFQIAGPPHGSLGPQLWVTALAAVILTTTGTATLTFVAMSLAEGALQLNGMPTALAGAGVLSAGSGSLGLIAVVLLHQSPSAGVLLAIPIGMFYVAYKAYLHERDNHERLDFLYRATQTVAAAPEIETAISGLLAQIRTMFRAEIAELTLFSASPTDPPLRTRLGPGEAQELMVPLPLGASTAIPETVFLPAPIDRARLAEHFDDRGFKDVMAVALVSDGRILGQLVVADRLGDVATFDQADLQLFRTLSTQASMALENGRLEKSLDQLSRLKEQLRFDAYHDTLTGLANRALLNSEIGDAVAEAALGGSPCAVMLLDLDDFKTVNDSLGHAAGDLLLVEVAARICACLRENDVAARLGGDEFAVLLRDTTGMDGAVDVAGRVLAALEQPVTLQGREAMVHASIGIAELSGDTDVSEVLRNADAAMYRAKEAGKNRYRLFEESMHSEAVRRLELRGALQRALERGEFVLHYQPLVELRTGLVADAEALIRWNNPEVGIVPPSEFIALAEETGLIVPIGRWVLQTAVHQLAVWQRENPGAADLRISVNLSGRQLAAPGLLDDVDRALRGSGLRPECLVLEITESVLMDDVEAALRSLRALKSLGVGLALDDFGTGYSSLSYLRAFPIDVLKLSKPFVDDLGTEGGHALVGAIAGLATALRMRTVAEGIEEPEQADMLRDLGYDIGQGYTFSRPLTAARFAEVVATQPFLRAELTPATLAIVS
jgi:diguanylate cyclase (GGDEF)-like protein